MVVFGVSFLSMIPIAIFNKKNKAKKEYIFEIVGSQEYYNPAEFQIFQPVTAVGASATILFGEGKYKG